VVPTGTLGCSEGNDGKEKGGSLGCLSVVGCYPEKAKRCWKSLGQITGEGESSHKANKEENATVGIYFMKAS